MLSEVSVPIGRLLDDGVQVDLAVGWCLRTCARLQAEALEVIRSGIPVNDTRLLILSSVFASVQIVRQTWCCSAS